VDQNGDPLYPPAGGDTLALFIVRELSDTFEDEANDLEQTSSARQALQSAVDQLQAVVGSLEDFEDAEHCRQAEQG
jgi:hypothetical protein